MSRTASTTRADGDTADGGRRPHLYLIDGSGYIFRAYHALPPMTRSDGTPVNAVFGFTGMLFKLLKDLKEEERPTHLAVVFDYSRITFRQDLYEQYKAQRPEAPEDLVPQFPLIRKAVEAFSVPAIEKEGFEADDIIATYVRQALERGFDVTIVSSDKDLMQLVGPHVRMMDPIKNRIIGPKEVAERFGVPPEKVADVLALMGDASDNVPGVPGIGPKTAAELIRQYGDLENLLAHAEEIPQPKRRQTLIENADKARLSKELVTLHADVPLDDWPLDSLKVKDIDPERLLPFLDENEFRSIRARVMSYLDAGRPAQERLKDAITVSDSRYEAVTTEEQLAGWVARIRAKGLVAIDTETTSLDAMRARLVGIALSVEPGHACYIPLAHDGGGEGELALEQAGELPVQLDVEKVRAALDPILADPAILKIGQNIKYDINVLVRAGFSEPRPIDDTMLVSYVLDSGLHGHGLDELARRHLGITPVAYKDVAGRGKKQKTFSEVGIAEATAYAAEDADLTLRLHHLLRPRLVGERLLALYETIERPLVPVVAEMERHGVLVDAEALRRLSQEFAREMARLEEEIHELAGHPFNIASPRQLGEVLFTEMGLQGGKKLKGGGWSTSAEVLERLAGEGHELPARVLDWRQLQKLKGTYTDALAEAVNPETGRVHTSFSLAATSTGRLASSDPNLQNIPVRTELGRRIRAAFIAPEGCRLLSADYSQIELRILAHLADIPALKQAFADGLDIHAMTASEIFGVPLDEIDRETRRRAKAINFGIIYGISAFGLARQLGIGREEAGEIIETYFRRFPGIRTYMEEQKRLARHQGHVTTLFGRRVHTPDINAKNPTLRGFAERAAINAPIQGTAADIIKRAMVRMPKALEAAGLRGKARMLLQVHDELVFEVDEDAVDETGRLVREVMANAPVPRVKLSVPLVVDVGTGRNWDEAH
ncbi:MAG: DNA polymerase I [Rhodothalassiaceae bacterium]|nr:MAG: DNA polymerase I [Rhodothalassiaceae bacterium]